MILGSLTPGSKMVNPGGSGVLDETLFSESSLCDPSFPVEEVEEVEGVAAVDVNVDVDDGAADKDEDVDEDEDEDVDVELSIGELYLSFIGSPGLFRHQNLVV